MSQRIISIVLICASLPLMRAAPAAAYAGPLFDAMAQTDESLNPARAYAVISRAGVTHMALFARLHRQHDGRFVVSQLARAHPGFFVLGTPKVFDERRDLSAGYVQMVLGATAHGHAAATFVGEILFTHGDKTGGEVTAGGERYVDPLAPHTAALLGGLARSPASIPVMTHWEVYDWPRDYPRFDELYRRFPHQRFIWPHAGFGRADQLTAVLSRHPNVWATLSKKDNPTSRLSDEEKAEAIGPPVIDEAGILRPEWREVMVRFHDRLMFATDAHIPARWAKYPQIVARWRHILAQLPAGAASDIAYGNAARLYLGEHP